MADKPEVKIRFLKPTMYPDDGHQYWNGERCEARKVLVTVADSPEFPQYWAREFVGQKRKAVEVTYGGETFYLDDENGDGWGKVTIGRGSPWCGHKSLSASSVEARRG